MADIYYKLNFFSDFHIGSGVSGGSESDALVKKNKNGLPFVPGKTLKGLIKDAAKDLYEGDFDYYNFIEACFGIVEENEIETEIVEENEIETGIYNFFYFNSELTTDDTNYFISNVIEKEKLYRNIPYTSIDEKTGISSNKSLRTMEVCIPLSFIGAISNIPNEYKDKMKNCLRMIKRLGSKRNRGLGRCQFDLINENERVQK